MRVAAKNTREHLRKRDEKMAVIKDLKMNGLLMGLATLLMAGPVSSLRADSVTIISPDKAETYAYSHLTRNKLVWMAKARSLSADVTFSNEQYTGVNEPLRRDSFLFKFPGVTFDPAKKQFVAQDKAGKNVAVATSSSSSPGGSIKAMPGTRVYICKHRGEVRVVLTATAPAPNIENPVTWVQWDGGIERFTDR